MPGESSVDRAVDVSAIARSAMAAIGFIPVLHLAAALSPVVLVMLDRLESRYALLSAPILYLVPPLVVRATTSIRPLPGGSVDLGSPAFLYWWFTAQWQVVFARLPLLEELLRLLPNRRRCPGRRVFASPAGIVDRRRRGHAAAALAACLLALARWTTRHEGRQRAGGGGRLTLRDLLSLAGAHWRLKVRLQTALLLLFCGGYFALQRIALLPERVFELSRVDLMIAFDPTWVWVYQSAYLLMGIVPWLADDRDDLRRYARGFVLLSAAGFACFLFWPVAGPRPAEVPRDAMYRFLVLYDGATNAFPSLHVGLTVYTVLFGVRASEGRLPAGMRAALMEDRSCPHRIGSRRHALASCA
jgi:hypothetical protein